jgi:hypothetical protein
LRVDNNANVVQFMLPYLYVGFSLRTRRNLTRILVRKLSGIYLDTSNDHVVFPFCCTFYNLCG